MSRNAFSEAFEAAVGHPPYEWQAEAATAPEPPRVIEAPTGAGKTEGILFAWLWRRLLAGDAALAARTPRRLAIALPMRTLVEQTSERIEAHLDRLLGTGYLDGQKPRVFKLLGGEAEDEWVLDATVDQVLVGTVDMLLSRALNRGYGRGRSLWPLDFGLLNADTWWAFDEVQLLDAALATSCQLAALRRDPAYGVDRLPNHTTWMSATLDPAWLETVDHERPEPEAIVRITERDRADGLKARLEAPKALRREVVAGATPVKLANRFAELVLEAHAAREGDGDAGGHGWLTLAVCNTVKQARALHEKLAKRVADAGADLVLLHSRFRPPEREAALARALGERPDPARGRIVVTTQVIEAGVDIDAAAIVTELCPWPSLVQRAGRLNRAGARPESELIVIDPGELTAKAAAPYEPEEVETARDVLPPEGEVIGFSPAEIEALVGGADRGRLLPRPRQGLALRRPDLVELFDTDPTLDGDDADVGGYIRLGDDLTLQVAWRPKGDPQFPANARQSAPAPVRDELCPVPIADRGQVAEREPWRWSYALREWERVGERDLRPGDIVVVASESGGYSPQLGWNPSSKDEVPSAPMPGGGAPAPESDATDATQATGSWLRISEHTDHVVERLERVLAALEQSAAGGAPLSEIELEALRTAARFHDAGKAHPAFQERVRAGEPEPPAAEVLLAKSPGGGRAAVPGSGRQRVFRHEVASVLVYQAHAAASERPADRLYELVSYLIGAHHGKLRLTPRLTNERPDDTDEGVGTEPAHLRACLGVRAGDRIPAGTDGATPPLDLGGGVTAQPVAAADLSAFELGGRPEDGWSWSDAALRLRDEVGLLRLAYLEALLRSADWAASAAEGKARTAPAAASTEDGAP